MKKKISINENFVFEAHSTDYQSRYILKKLVQNNFKFLKVGPKLTYNYAKSLFYMHHIEKKYLKKNSNVEKTILRSMIHDNRNWKGYYNKKIKSFLNSQLDRMRYYLNSNTVNKSIKILKKILIELI